MVRRREVFCRQKAWSMVERSNWGDQGQGLGVGSLDSALRRSDMCLLSSMLSSFCRVFSGWLFELARRDWNFLWILCSKSKDPDISLYSCEFFRWEEESFRALGSIGGELLLSDARLSSSRSGLWSDGMM